MKEVRILAIGDNVCDKYLSRGKMYPGGQCVNTCAYARMNQTEAAYLGKFGSDEVAAYNQEILARLRNGETPVEVTTHTEDSWTRMTRSTWGFMEILSISTQAVSPTRPKMVHPTPLVIPTSRSIRLNRSTRRSMSS